ncbi:MAG: cytochrome c oxidase subunit II [Caulobacteraceae bacterium]|nr:cytochrome c oxidase subunit II [Caulobacter sp.]
MRRAARSAAVRGAVATGFAALYAAPAMAADLVGQPTDRAIGLQPSNSVLRDSAAFFHNIILMPALGAVCLFVLALLVYIVVKFNAKANPTPARFSHNTPIEIVWTVVPVLILMFFAIFSFRLLYAYHNVPKPDVTIKVTGNQWYWSYEYPDAGVPEYTSNPLPEKEAEAKGPGLYRLAVDKPLVVPVGKNIQILATGADVLHAFFVPAFGIQTTTIPGRVNQTWFRPEKTGVFYGQCNELCGVNHSFMPIEVDVVTQPQYDAWVAAHSTKKPEGAPGGVAPAVPSPTAAPMTPAPAATAPNASMVGPSTGATTPPAAPAGQPPAAQTGPRGKAKLPGASPA